MSERPEPHERIVMDLDDFEDDHASWALPLLDKFYQRSGGTFKATLFTIPAHTSEAVLRDAAARPYLELGVHGWVHSTRECMWWDETRTRQVLAECLAAGRQHEEDDTYYTTVFKAPYWEATDAVYKALADAGWAVAEHPRNAHKLPRNLRAYILSPIHQIGTPHAIRPIVQAHGHFTNEVGNGFRENLGAFKDLLALELPFAFVSEVAA